MSTESAQPAPIPVEQVTKALGVLGLPTEDWQAVSITGAGVWVDYENGTSEERLIDWRPAWERDRA